LFRTVLNRLHELFRRTVPMRLDIVHDHLWCDVHDTIAGDPEVSNAIFKTSFPERGAKFAVMPTGTRRRLPGIAEVFFERIQEILGNSAGGEWIV
jgi:hypothetical protein